MSRTDFATNGDAPAHLSDLDHTQRWTAWQIELVPGRKKPTKVPYRAVGVQSRANDPGTWLTRAEAEAIAAALEKPFGAGGVGAFLGDIGEGWSLGGIDYDSCIGALGLADWAEAGVEAIASYGEVSPSGGGLKQFFLYRTVDLDALRSIFGIRPDGTGRKWSRASGGDHPPGIELYLSRRYFAVTGDCGGLPADLTVLSEDGARKLTAQALPLLLGDRSPRAVADPATAGTAAAAALPMLGAVADPARLQERLDAALAHVPTLARLWQGDLSDLGADRSRSAVAFRLGSHLKQIGFAEAEARSLLTSHTLTAEWMAEKGEALNGREWNRLWRHATPPPFGPLPMVPEPDGGGINGSEAPAAIPDVPAPAQPAMAADAVAVARLAALPPPEYERQRKPEAERMGVRVKALDDMVRQARGPTSPTAGHGIALHYPEPWPELVVLADLLDDISAAVSRHVVLPSKAADVVALWVAHTWVYEKFEHSPRLGITSPAPRCGKSTLLDVLRILCRRTLKADSLTASGVFRTVQALSPLTLLIDEADSFLPENEELRGVLNSGYEMSGMVIRVVEMQGQHVPMPFATFAPVALATIRRLPATLADRAVPIRLKRKTAAEKVAKLRAAGNRAALADLARKLRRWAEDGASHLLPNPGTPDQLNDRAGDISVPLLSIAASAGETWSRRGRSAIVELFGQNAAAEDDAEQGTTLLADIRAIFDDPPTDRIPSAELSGRLAVLHDRPWPECNRGRPITPAHLAGLLKPFGVRPGTIRMESNETPKGYYRSAFEDAWERYLPPDKQGTP